MADRTVRAIFEARVSGAKKDIIGFGRDVADTGKKVDGLTKDLKSLGSQKVKPTVDVEIDKAKTRLRDLTRELADLKAQPTSIETEFKIEQTKAAIKDVRGLIKDLTAQKVEVKIDASIKDAQKRIADVTQEIGLLRTMEVTPQVTADIREAQKRLRDARSELRDLNGAKASMKVTADTSDAKKAADDLADDIGDAGAEAGDEAGQGVVSGIIGALRTIPIAGAVVGVGVAIAGGILLGIKEGLQVEAERDIFSAQTGLDEDTSARFGRAAGEAYANAWGDSVAANLDTAKFALQAGIIDSDATDAEIENVIAKLTGLNDLFEYDIASSVRGVGNLMKTGLAKDADQAFDLIVAASQKLQSDDLLDTLNEYSSQFVQVGIDGKKAFGLLVQGAEAGARDTDNVADAIKEVNLRVGEGSKAVNEALGLLGLRGDLMGKAFNKGGPAAAKAIDTILDRLRILRDKGGNTQEVIANLFGGPGEDLGAAIYALNLDTAARSLDGVEGSAGAAERALATMSDNTATKIEEARRNVSVAMDGIKGALAEAFGDDIGGIADWVKRNRAPLMEFFLDVINGAFDMGIAFAEFSATALDAIADVVDSAADILVWLPGYSPEDKRKMQESADNIRGVADTIRTEIPSAMNEARDRANEWAAPEILKARLHDATVAMTQDIEGFAEEVDGKDLTVRINGETVDAEKALDILVANIDEKSGTVTIDGDQVPAEEALDRLLQEVENGNRDIKVGADTGPGKAQLRALKGLVSLTESSIHVSADTAAAERKLRALERDRYATLNIRVAGINSVGGLTKDDRHDGGLITRGLHSGGRVPGSDPGYDNVLWPLNSGGRTLIQPLSGGEYVVNSKDAAYWAPVLEWMNGGGRPGAVSETVDQHIGQITVYADSFDEIERQAREKQRRAALDGRNS